MSFADSSLDVSHTLASSGTFAFNSNVLGTTLLTVTEEVSGEVGVFILTAATLLGIGDSGTAFVVSSTPTSTQYGLSLAVNSGAANVVTLKAGSGVTGTFRIDFATLNELKGSAIN
jgi:hypothetical protein